jgi:hypothetical protein
VFIVQGDPPEEEQAAAPEPPVPGHPGNGPGASG